MNFLEIEFPLAGRDSQGQLVGTPPERKMIDISTCQDGARAYQEETIVVGTSGGLKDVVVYLRDAPPST